MKEMSEVIVENKKSYGMEMKLDPAILAKSCTCPCDIYCTRQVPKIDFRNLFHEICCTSFGHVVYSTSKSKLSLKL